MINQTIEGGADDPESDAPRLVGVKHDVGKDDWTLAPWGALTEMVAVLTHGAQKYSRHNWKTVIAEEGGVERYQAALMRHLVADFRGEELDPDSGFSHKAHAMCCLAYLLEHRLS